MQGSHASPDSKPSPAPLSSDVVSGEASFTAAGAGELLLHAAQHIPEAHKTAAIPA